MKTFNNIWKVLAVSIFLPMFSSCYPDDDDLGPSNDKYIGEERAIKFFLPIDRDDDNSTIRSQRIRIQTRIKSHVIEVENTECNGSQSYISEGILSTSEGDFKLESMFCVPETNKTNQVPRLVSTLEFWSEVDENIIICFEGPMDFNRDTQSYAFTTSFEITGGCGKYENAKGYGTVDGTTIVSNPGGLISLDINGSVQY